ncbi:MAG: beta-propeller domain-containing protein [Planctomycetaceae bacterium]|nr:beta-propeller domain-containing protein [Planctomycetales bacterium]MCB9927063.1 beta-propeller domain-containing protein [Planctomycetaceae bacterium]
MKRRDRRKRRLYLEPLEARVLLDASGDFFDVRQNSDPQALDVLRNDVFDQDYSGPRLITSTSFGSKGGLIRIADDRKSLEYTPPADGFGTETFTYYVDHNLSATVSVSLVAPLAHDQYTINPNDEAWTLDVMANDVFWDGYDGAQQITSVSETLLGGSVEVGANGQSIVYTPPKYEVGKDAFIYFVDDLYPAEVIVNIRDPLSADTKLNIVWNTEEVVLDVLANDSFWDGYEGDQQITHLVVRENVAGSFSIADDGLSIAYSPAHDFQGIETVRYVVDGRHEQSVTVQVHRPVRDDWPRLYTNGQGDLAGRYIDLVSNDTFTWQDDRYAPGDSRRWVTTDVVDRITSVTTSQADATIEIAPDGQGVFYTAPADFLGIDTFNYTVDEKYTATVTVTVTETPTGGGGSGGGGGGSQTQPPSNVCRTLYDAKVVNQNSDEVQIDVLANDFQQRGFLCDPYEGKREITDVIGPSSGSVTVSSDRSLVTYTPDEDFVGSDSFQYIVDDIWTEYVTVNVVRRVRDDQFRVEPDFTDNLDVLANDLFGADYTGPQRITEVTTSDAGATISIGEAYDSITYAPPAGFSGEDHFTYVVDGGLKADVTVYVSSSREALLRKFDSETLFGPLLEEALGQWDQVFGTTIEQYPWYRDLYFSTFAEGAAIDRSSASEVRVHSETNVQVQGIDEADIVETDSEFLYVVREGELVIAKAWPADELSIVSQTTIEGQPIGEYLNGTRLTVVSQNYEIAWRDIFSPESPAQTASGTNSLTDALIDGAGIGISPEYPQQSSATTVVSVFDVSDRSSPKLVQKTKLDGTYVESRRIGNQIFLVQRNQRLTIPGPILTCEPLADDPMPVVADGISIIPPMQTCTYETRDDYIIRVTELFDSMLPHYASYDADGNLVRTGLAIAPEDIYRPQDKSARNLVSVVSIDMSINEPGLSGASGILTSGADTIYGGWDGLYVLDRSYNYEDGDTTQILKFDWNADTGLVDFASFGHVAGYLLNQFSVDTFDGYLRIATTLWNRGGGNYSNNAENTIFVLRDDEGVMEVVGDLQNLGFTEYIKSVRFIGDRAFVTTFRDIDPLFVIDMSDPSEPLPVGHVTLPGFSSYMQMIDENHLLTIGRNAVTDTTGSTQVILFDVTDVTRPRIVGRHSFYRNSFSIAETDHHAFGWFAAHDVLAIPLAENRRRRIDADEDGYPEAWEYYREDDLAVLEIDVNATIESRDGVQLRGEVANNSQVLRGAFIDDVLYSIARNSITAVDIHEPTTILGQATISPNDAVPAGDDTTAGMEAETRQLVKVAREEVLRHFGRPVVPMLITAESPNALRGDQTPQSEFLFSVGDQMLRVTADREGNVRLVDEQFEFSAQNADHWRNQSKPTDVNGDGQTSPLDALVLINEHARAGARKLSVQSVLRQIEARAERQSEFFDVSGDGWLSPIDVLLVIDHINHTISAEGEYSATVEAIFGAGQRQLELLPQPSQASSLPIDNSSPEGQWRRSAEARIGNRRDDEAPIMWTPLEELPPSSASQRRHPNERLGNG